MNIFKKKSGSAQSNFKIPKATIASDMPTSAAPAANGLAIADVVLQNIGDGVIVTDKSGVVRFINPAAVTLIDSGTADAALGLSYDALIHLESKDGRALEDSENPLIVAMHTGEPLTSHACILVSGLTNKRLPVAISVIHFDGGGKIITLRDITKELAEEGELTEFISTASHEMRTPVATIDGYLSLCLNPQTAAIDERARGYLTSAQIASKHLGKLFQDLLDVTKLDDGRIRPELQPVEMVGLVKKIADGFLPRAAEKHLAFQFGASSNMSLTLDQVVYASVDVNFLQEIMNNLIDNAIKYTPSGGSIYINVRGDGDRVLINVTDTGIGIGGNDIGHIFQKFYRADNSDTRTIGGTGLGLYLVKQRAEAMGGHVWAESSFGEGTTFYVSLPRITGEEYEKRLNAVKNAAMVPNPGAFSKPLTAPIISSSAPPTSPIPNQINQGV